MKKLLSLLSVLTISGTAVPTTIAASPYQKEDNNNNNLQLSNLENLKRIKRQNLPIQNVGNWDLTTGQGYFKYLGWAVAYSQGIYQNYSQLEDICASNSDYVDLQNRDGWSDRHHKTTSNEGFIDRTKEENNNDFKFDNQLLDSSESKLINNTDSTQKILTSGYSHSVTKGRKVTNSFKITAKILKDIFSFEFNNSNEWNEQSTDTLTAPPQSVEVPANSYIKVYYKLFKNKKIVNNSIIWQELSLNQNKYTVSFYPPNAIEGGWVKWYSYTLNEWIKLIKENNLNWILHIPNAFLQEKEDGKIVGRIAGLANYESIESYYEVDYSSAIKLN